MARPADMQEGEPNTVTVGAAAVGRGEMIFWYGTAGVTYVGVSIVEKGLLNWFAGPLWLVAFVWLGPLATERWRRWGHRR